MSMRNRSARWTAWLGVIAMSFVSVPAVWSQTTRVAQVDVTGNDHINKEAILARISTKPGDEFSQTKIDQDVQTIHAMGFFKAVAPPRVEDTPAGKKVTFVVTEWPVIQKIQFTGNKSIDDATLRGLMATKEGQVLNTPILDADITKITDLFRQKGYIAQVTGGLGENFEQTGVLVIPIVEVTVNAVNVTGNRKTKEYVVRRELTLKPGDVYNRDALVKDYRRLERLDIFEPIEEPKVVQASEPGKVDITWNVKEKRTGQVSVGFGYSAAQKLVGRAELTETNFRGRGQGVNLLYEVGSFNGGSSVDVGFFNPYIDKKRTSLSLDVYNRLVYRFQNAFQATTVPETEQYNERRKGAAITLTRPLSEIFRLSVGLRHDNVNTNNFDPTLFNFPLQDGRVTSSTIRGIEDTRDISTNPTGGSYHTLSLELGNADVTEKEPSATTGGSVTERAFKSNFGKTVIDARHYWGLKPHKATDPAARQKERIPVFAGRLMGGISTGTLPFFEHFFLGGADTIRSYVEDRFWGTKMFLVSGEFRMPVAPNIIGVLFTDYGDAWGAQTATHIANFPQTSGFEGQYGVGLGIRVTTPIGPIRLDYGVGREGGRTHFSIGHSF